MEDECFTKEDRIAFLKKKNEARKAASKLDWEKDKAMSYGNKPGYRYLSIDKMKRNLLPVFMGLGLDFNLSYRSVEDKGAIGTLPAHWIIECEVTLTDMDTGYSERTTVFGESGDVLDKGLSKASTYALKTWLSDTFMLIDGIDPDMDPTEMVVSKTFTPKTDKEKDEIKSKVLSNGVKPEETVQPTAEPSKPAKPAKPKAAKPAKPEEPEKTEEAPAEPEKKEEPAKEEHVKTPAEEAIDKLKAEAVAAFKPSIPQQNMINRIMAKWSEQLENGEVTQEQYDAMMKDKGDITNSTSAVAFIKKYKEA